MSGAPQSPAAAPPAAAPQPPPAAEPPAPIAMPPNADTTWLTRTCAVCRAGTIAGTLHFCTDCAVSFCAACAGGPTHRAHTVTQHQKPEIFAAAWNGDIFALVENRLVLPVDDRNQRGQTLLYCAANRGFLDVVVYLVQNGADVNLHEASVSSTPLHAAAFYQHREVVMYLLRNGANRSCINRHRLTAYQEAKPHVREIFDRPPPIPEVCLPSLGNTSTLCGTNLIPYLQPVPPPGRQPVDPASREYQDIVRCMNTTILTVHTSFKKAPYHSYNVHSVMRNHDPAKLKFCQEQHGPYNPRYFFHGTSLQAAHAILDTQFKLSTSGDWGPGIYVAENSSTSNLFAMDKPNPDGFSYMFLCFVNLGNMSVYKEKLKDGGTRLSYSGNTICCIHPKYKEFVLYNPDRVYPAYLIKYKVNAGAPPPQIV